MTQEMQKITYEKLMWLFMIGSVLGVFLEGFWCLAIYGHWETHVVTVWGPFCIIYGLGMAGCYIGAALLKKKNLSVRFLTFSLIGAGVEFICGWVLEYGLNMKAWDYSDSFLNIKGYVNLTMTLIWGILGIGFGYLVPALECMFDKMKERSWHTACICLTVFMVINFAVTVVCFVRWSARHENIPAANRIEQLIDEAFCDEWMQKRFCEWRFID